MDLIYCWLELLPNPCGCFRTDEHDDDKLM